MKKSIVVLFLILFSSISKANMTHYNKYNKIEMEIFRNGELIGYNYYFFTKKGDETIVTNQINFSVKLFLVSKWIPFIDLKPFTTSSGRRLAKFSIVVLLTTNPVLISTWGLLNNER